MDIRYLVISFLTTTLTIVCIHGSVTFREIVLRAKNRYDVKTFVLISSFKSEIANRFSAKLQQNFSVPIIHYTNLWNATFNHNKMEPTPILLKDFGEWLLYIIFLDDFETRHAVLRNAFRILERRQYANVIFVIENSTRQVLDGLFRRCFHYGLLRVVIILQTSPPTLFSYRPFDGFKIIQIGRNAKLFSDKVLNLNKYEIKTARSGNPPSLVWHKTKSGLLIPKGFTGHLVTTFTEKRNATLAIDLIREESPSEALRDRLIRKETDLTLTLFPMLHFNFGEYAYPTSYQKYSIIVPAPRTIPANQNFTLPFQPETWLSLIFGLCYCTVVIYIVINVLINRQDISSAFLVAFCMLINISGIGPFYRNQIRLIVFYLPLFIFGFIGTNLYLASLTTFLTSPAYERAITSWSDIEVAGLKIIAEQMELEYLFMLAPDLSKYSKLFKSVLHPEFVRIRETLNNSNAVMMISGIWSSIDDLQRYRNIIKFQDSGIPTIPMHLSIIFQPESPFIKDFIDHIMMAYQSGLIYYWEKSAFVELLQANLLNTTKIPVEGGPGPLDIATLHAVLYFLIAGLIVSTVIFCIELIVNLLNRN